MQELAAEEASYSWSFMFTVAFLFKFKKVFGHKPVLSSFQVSCFIYLYHNDLLPLSFRQIFKPAVNSIITQQEFQNAIDPIIAELLSKSFLYFFNDLKYGTPYLPV